MLDQDAPEAQNESIFRSGTPTTIHQEDLSAVIEIPFFKQELRNLFLHPSVPSETKPVKNDGAGIWSINYSTNSILW